MDRKHYFDLISRIEVQTEADKGTDPKDPPPPPPPPEEPKPTRF